MQRCDKKSIDRQNLAQCEGVFIYTEQTEKGRIVLDMKQREFIVNGEEEECRGVIKVQ